MFTPVPMAWKVIVTTPDFMEEWPMRGHTILITQNNQVCNRYWGYQPDAKKCRKIQVNFG
jgi:hypothetical protein